uniref:Uncharacterized protein n=1 Tax=Setaria italica TaxID=4555 RepID=K4AN53_SETIT
MAQVRKEEDGGGRRELQHRRLHGRVWIVGGGGGEWRGVWMVRQRR